MIIAIDGPAGAGKSTVAKAVASHLGLFFLDTGAMYRALTLMALRNGTDPTDEVACEVLARTVSLDFDEEGSILIDGEPGEPDIRGEEVTRGVSLLSRHPGVRSAVVARQRAIGLARCGIVAEGRDTTTVVFPGADHKFFLVASARERARRRALQIGTPSEIDRIEQEIARRDELDSTRSHSPLVQAPDAVRIATDELDAEGVCELILNTIRAAEGGAEEL